MTVIAGVVLSYRLGHPRVFVFDEVYYANDALDWLTTGAQRTFPAHPPLGELLIAPGIVVAGFDPVGWRIDSVIAGAGCVWLTYGIAWRLTSSTAKAALAAVLLLTDGIFFTAGRLGMLDIFVCLFTLLLLSHLMRRDAWGGLRRWAAVAGVLLGLAVAVKWSAVPLVPLALASVGGAGRRSDRTTGVRLAAWLLACATVVYACSYTPWLVSGSDSGVCARVRCGRTVFDRVAALPAIQLAMFEGDRTSARASVNRAGGWTWIGQRSPSILYMTCPASSCARLLDRGDVLLWLPALLLLVCPIVPLAVRNRTRVGPSPAVTGKGLTAATGLLLWLPWVANPRTYSFYAAPMVALLAILMAAVVPRRLTSVAAIAAVLVLALQWTSLAPGMP